MNVVGKLRASAIALVLLIWTSACGGPRRPTVATPGEPVRAAGPATAPGVAQAAAVAADATFMKGMIQHHAQAVVMTVLVPARTARPELQVLARRIAASQVEEMARMGRWLAARGEAGPDTTSHAGHAGAAHGQPGMLTPAELEQLAAASGEVFDRLFLQLMIRHHEGALTMVAELNAVPGAGQEAELFQFAASVDADQRAEIARMRRLQSGLQ